MSTCSHCGQPVSETANFCEQCGMSLTEDPQLVLVSNIKDLLSTGKKIEAIRLAREKTGIGLAEAKNMVEAIESGGFNATQIPPVGFSSTASDAELIELLQSRGKIEAIKRHRELTGAGLKESKEYVEGLAGRQGIASPAKGCGTACLVGFIVVLSAITAMACSQ